MTVDGHSSELVVLLLRLVRYPIHPLTSVTSGWYVGIFESVVLSGVWVGELACSDVWCNAESGQGYAVYWSMFFIACRTITIDEITLSSSYI